jgi:polysaccharide chain length determinant protein (PEP-CTERM system associated)
MDPSAQLKLYLDIAWRRKWWIVVPACMALVVSIALALAMPKVFRATTSILVIRQSIPEGIVRSTVTQHIEERVRSLELQILSRSYLEPIAREFNMLPVNASEAEIENTCRRLRANIISEFDRQEYSWFRISVEDVDAKRAAGIANRLADLFIEQNNRIRASQAAGAVAATENWEGKYSLELAKRDQAILEFRQQYTYELPDQQPANFQLLNSAQGRVAQLTSDIQSHNDRLIALRTQQQTQRSIDASLGLPDATGVSDDARLVLLEHELSDLLVNYTEANPLVKRKRERIAELVQSRTLPVTPGGPATLPVPTRVDPIAAQIVTIGSELAALEGALTRENTNIETYRARIGNAPQRQQRLLELTRDYDQVKHQLDTAVTQTTQAQHSQDLEATKNGEQFEIQDRAYPPAVPFKPDVLQLIAMGVAVGLAIGGGLVAGREFIDQTVRGEEEFVLDFPNLPVYGVIPSLEGHRGNGFISHAAAGRTGTLA